MTDDDIEKDASPGPGEAQDGYSTNSSEREDATARNTNANGSGEVKDGLSDNTGRRTEEQQQDPFEVGWENGDHDPLCPRSMGVARKWLIVFITCFGSLCV